MGILVPHGELGFVDARAAQIERELKEGKPTVGWRGDRRLELRVGKLTDHLGNLAKDPKTGRQMVRYEVWRDCSDTGVKNHRRWGQFRRVGTWEMHEAEQILVDLVVMDPRTRGAKTIDEKIAADDRRAEKEQLDVGRESAGPYLEFARRLRQDEYWGAKHHFGMYDPDKTGQTPGSPRARVVDKRAAREEASAGSA